MNKLSKNEMKNLLGGRIMSYDICPSGKQGNAICEGTIVAGGGMHASDCSDAASWCEGVCISYCLE